MSSKNLHRYSKDPAKIASMLEEYRWIGREVEQLAPDHLVVYAIAKPKVSKPKPERKPRVDEDAPKPEVQRNQRRGNGYRREE